jgi:hypothetical protein
MTHDVQGMQVQLLMLHVTDLYNDTRRRRRLKRAWWWSHRDRRRSWPCRGGSAAEVVSNVVEIEEQGMERMNEKDE